jgi:hypothetical protein
VRRVRLKPAGRVPGPISARAIAAYMFRMAGGKVRGATSLEEIDAMTADELGAFAEANPWGGASAILHALDEAA